MTGITLYQIESELEALLATLLEGEERITALVLDFRERLVEEAGIQRDYHTRVAALEDKLGQRTPGGHGYWTKFTAGDDVLLGAARHPAAVSAAWNAQLRARSAK